MKIYWTDHAKEKFLARLLKYDITTEEVEVGVEEQEFRIDEGFDEEYQNNKYKTIFPCRNVMVTAEKAEGENMIFIITLWGSSDGEVAKWQRGK